MKSKIEITGQPRGNYLLFNSLNNGKVIDVKKQFNNYILVFATKKDAVFALKSSIKKINSEREKGEKKYGHMASLSLAYDASQAKIV